MRKAIDLSTDSMVQRFIKTHSITITIITSTRTLLNTLISNSTRSLSTQPIHLHPAAGSQVKTQFNHQPLRPKPNSKAFQFLPPAEFKLRIVSISYNRPTLHGLLNPNFSSSNCQRYTDPNGHFILTAIPPQSANLNRPIPSYVRSLNSCFSKQDQERWRLGRIQRRKSSSKPIHELRLTFSLRIKELHKSSVIRKSIRKRWIAALKLIVQYGARPSRSVTPTDDSSHPTSPQVQKYSPLNSSELQAENDLISLDPNDSGFGNWLDEEHYYIVHPNLSLNTVGLVELIDSIRTGLRTIKTSISSPHPRGLKRSSNAPMASRPKSNHDRRLSNEPTVSPTSQLVRSQSVDSHRTRSFNNPPRITNPKTGLPHRKQNPSPPSDQATSHSTHPPDRRDRPYNHSTKPDSCPPPPSKIPIPKR